MSSLYVASHSGRPGSLAPLGLMLATISFLAVVALLHHPVSHGHDAATVINSMRGQVLIDQIVHGGLAIIYGLMSVGMFVFSSRLGVWRFPVLAGVVAFSCGFVLILLAAITDGFIAPAVVQHCLPTSAGCMSDTLVMLRFGALQIEFLTRFALVAIAIAVLSWGGALITTPAAPRWSGALGLASGVLQLAALLMTRGMLTPHSLVLVMLGEVAWFLIVATLMIMGRTPFGASVVAIP